MPSYCYVAVSLARDEDGMIVPGEATEAPNVEVARRRAASVAFEAGNFASRLSRQAGQLRRSLVLLERACAVLARNRALPGCQRMLGQSLKAECTSGSVSAFDASGT